VPDDELEISPESLAYEAKEVQLLLSKELVKKAWDATEARIISEWKKAPSVGERELARAKMDVFASFKQELRALAERVPLQKP
jgi:hypothetical protein